jgi:putative redox protein
MKTRTIWKKEHQFTSYHEHNAIQIDGARQHGNGPKSLLLSGLAGCSGIDIVDILKKMRVDFSALEVDAETTQTEENPKVFNEIHLVYKIKTAKENKEKVQKAIDLSLEKYCGVAAMLKKNSEIKYSIQLL